VKSGEEIMEIVEAYDLTGSFRDAAELAGCSHHTAQDNASAIERYRAMRLAINEALRLDKARSPLSTQEGEPVSIPGPHVH
jgi:hypothetical protein